MQTLKIMEDFEMNFIDSALNVILNKMRLNKAGSHEHDDSCPIFCEIPTIDKALSVDGTFVSDNPSYTSAIG